MLPLPLEMPTSLIHHSPRRTTGSHPQTTRVAYIVTDDEHLSDHLGVATNAIGICSKWFRSASEYLAFKRPEVASCLLIGPRLSDMCGLDLQRLLSPACTPPIILLSHDGDLASCVRAIKDGADDFLEMPLATPDLLRAMNAAFGKHEASLRLHRENEDLISRWHTLTSREAEVMRYVAAGFLNKQTAGELNITENTIQVHRGRVMRKMRADSTAMLVRMSLRLAQCGQESMLSTSMEESWGKHLITHADELELTSL